MSSRRANIRSSKKYDTTCVIEAHHDFTATMVLTAALFYIPSFVSLPLLAALNKVDSPAHNHIEHCRETSASKSRRLTSLIMLLPNRAIFVPVNGRSCNWAGPARLTFNLGGRRQKKP